MRELHVSQRRLAGIADVSPITIRALQHGIHRSYRTMPLVKLSGALGWGPDGIIRIGRGADPAAIEAEVEADDRIDVVALVVEIREQLDSIGERLSRLEQQQPSNGHAQRRGA
jgi:hypothetical protein